MTSFPLDDYEYSAESLGAWLCTRTRGVHSAEENFTVTTNGDMTINVSPGLAWMKIDDYWGAVSYEEDTTTLAIAPADGTLTRIDAICIQYNKNTPNESAQIIVKRGAYAANPIIPAIQRDDNFEEIYIASVRVRAGTVEITAADISDQRLNEEYCGLMRDSVTGIPTEQLYAQFSEYLEQLKTAIDGVIDGSQYMLTAGYDPRGAVAEADGIDGYVENKISALERCWIKDQCTIGSGFTNASTMSVEYNPSLSLMTVRGRLISTGTVANGAKLFTLPSSVIHPAVEDWFFGGANVINQANVTSQANVTIVLLPTGEVTTRASGISGAVYYDVLLTICTSEWGAP